MEKIALICDRCNGKIILDETGKMGKCRSCGASYCLREDQLIYQVTQNITKHVYGQDGKDIEELIVEGYRLIQLGNSSEANKKFRSAINIEPNCWDAWLGYASTGAGDGRVMSIVNAYRSAYAAAENESQQMATFTDMVQYFPNKFLRASYIRSFAAADTALRDRIFQNVKNVIGCDESMMAQLAIDIAPTDWNAVLAMAAFRQIRAKWCGYEGFLRRLPLTAQEVRDLFIRAYALARNESSEATAIVLNRIEKMKNDPAYAVLYKEISNQIQKIG